MPRIVSDTQELHQVGETVPPTSAAAPHGASVSKRLLSTLCQLPPASSLTDAVALLLRSFSEVLPGYSLGVRIPPDDEHPAVLLTFPPSDVAPENLWTADAILFPIHAHERRFPLTCRPEPACFHCAADEPALDVDSSTITQTLELCANALSTAIRFVDAQHALRKRDQEIDKLRSILVQSDKLSSLGEISAGLVHELSNPLTSIVAYTDYLRQKSERRGDDPDDVERLRRVGEAADLILSFTRAIVSYARPDDGIPCPVDVAQVVDQALLFCKHVIDDSNVIVRRHIDPELPNVKSNRGQLIQVIVNLVTNACQAMAPEGGTLTVATAVDPASATLTIRVEDTGPGIHPEHLDHVFDPFFTTKEQGVGTGLGLNIVRQIVSRSCGTVRVESPPGCGAVFSVTLPIHDPDAT